jgi:hypothetical protein
MTQFKTVKTNRRVLRRFEVRTYDVWGNARDGFEVNAAYRHGIIEVRGRVVRHNAGTPHEFETIEVTDRQLNRALGCRGVSWGGDDQRLFGELKNGKPIGELNLITEGEE